MNVTGYKFSAISAMSRLGGVYLVRTDLVELVTKSRSVDAVGQGQKLIRSGHLSRCRRLRRMSDL